MRCLPASVLVAAVVLAAATPAHASELIDRDARLPTLTVNGAGEALVAYHARGRDWKVSARGAINARPPRTNVPQVTFRLNYAGKAIAGATCLPYDGPPLAWLVRACKAPDGSYWALQSWQRPLANYGVTPNAAQRVWELRLSHWTGPLAQLEIEADWSYRRFDHLYGRYTYLGGPVHGFRVTPQGSPLDSYGRNLYLDTFGSRYGPGWKRENSFVAQRPNGAFCYSFVPHGNRPAGKGVRYRATVIGPGVTPDVMWQGEAPGTFDLVRERQANAEQQALFADSGPNGCRPR
jgi:hypothetical protein